MAIKFCPACGNQLELNISEDAQTFRCPICGADVCASYEPAYSDYSKPSPDYLDIALVACEAYAEELGDRYFDEPDNC